MTDEQFEILRQRLNKFHSDNQKTLRDADALAKRRGKFIWMPYQSRASKDAENRASMGVNDVLEKQKIPIDFLLSKESGLGDFFKNLSSLQNKPKQK